MLMDFFFNTLQYLFSAPLYLVGASNGCWVWNLYLYSEVGITNNGKHDEKDESQIC